MNVVIKAWRMGIFVAFLVASGCSPVSLLYPRQPGERGDLRYSENDAISGGLILPIAGALSLTGIVVFPGPERQVTATPAQVVGQATVSLIDTISGITVASGLTDPAGSFTLNLGAFGPAADATYLLEASKGLMAQLPGFVSARMRTIVQYKTTGSIPGAPGWLSVTNASLPGTVIINSWTTAVAIESGLDPANVPPAGTIGKVNGSFGLNPTPIFVGHSDAELIAVRNDINAYLSANLDPVGTLTAVKPTVTSVSPASANAYGLVTVGGAGFSPVIGGTTVTVGGIAAPILMASANQLVAQVPVGATSGNLLVATPRGGTSNATPFAVPNGSAVGISGLNPGTVSAGGTINVTGWGFSATPADNVVVFQTVASTVSATPSSASTTNLVVTVPATATSGTITVAVAGNASNAYYLTIPSAAVPLTEVFPTSATRYGEFYVYGSALGTTAGTLTVGGVSASVKRWRNAFIHAELDANTPLGSQPIVVTTSAGQQNSSLSINVLAGVVGPFASIGTMAAGITGSNAIPAWTHKFLYLTGGDGNGSAGYRGLAQTTIANDGALNLASQTIVGNPIIPFDPSGPAGGVHFQIGFSLPGQQFWLRSYNSIAWGYLQFSDADGNFSLFNTAATTSLPASGGCHTFYLGPKAAYQLGNGDTDSTAAYSLIQADGSLGAWTNLANYPIVVTNSGGSPGGGATTMMLIGSQLYASGPSAGVSRTYVNTLAANGALSSPWVLAANPTYGAGLVDSAPWLQVGQYVYQFGLYNAGPYSSLFYRASVGPGGIVFPFTSYTNGGNVYFHQGGNIVIGGYVYLFGSYTNDTGGPGFNNKIWRASIIS